MSTPTIYRSSDASAPQLTGQVGSLVALLHACLVAGYGSQSAAGWTSSFTATNKEVYRQAGGNQFYLDVDDSGPGAGGAQEAIVRGWEISTAVETGTNPFPTVAQVASNVPNWRKSATANSTPRAWQLIADDRSFMLAILDGDNAGLYKMYYFGDFYSLKSGDGYRTCITVRTTANSATTTGTLAGGSSFTTSFNTTGAVGLYEARIAAGTGTSNNALIVTLGSGTSTTGDAFPALDGNMYISRLLVGDSGGGSTNFFRGWLRGIYFIQTQVGLNDGDTFAGTGDFAGRSFMVIRGVTGAASCVAIETTAWDTSS